MVRQKLISAWFVGNAVQMGSTMVSQDAAVPYYNQPRYQFGKLHLDVKHMHKDPTAYRESLQAS
jgi:hypothetical protein